jgi:GNAT superfamily N-acetyltransferase
MDYVLRKAKLDERLAIAELIAESARGLSKADYSGPQIEAAIATVFGVDTSLILDQTYFVVDLEGRLIGCGGWSRRKTLFGGDQFSNRDARELDPNEEPAKIRAFFVHPEHARKGIGRALLLACENEARAYGFRSVELMATLPGVPLYQACGYQGAEEFELELGDGVKLELLPMKKDLRKVDVS